jgi:hypothetical protein
MELRDSVARNKTLLATTKEDHQVWLNAVDGGLKVIELGEVKKALEKEMAQVGKNSPAYPNLDTEKKDVEDCLKALKDVNAKYEKEVKRLEKEIKDTPNKLDAFRKGRKRLDDSLYSRCDAVLKKYKIDRGRYHGGNFNGVNIIKIMQENLLMDEIELILLESGRETEEKVRKLCNEVRTALRAWDMIFARIHASDPTPEYCDKLQGDIDLAMKQWRELGLSVTPKLHGLECHVVAQMRAWGGIKLLLEYWVEHEHQIGNRMDTQWKSLPLAAQGRLRAKHDVAARHPETMTAREKIISNFTGVRMTTKKEATTAKNNIKQEGRKTAIDLLKDRMLGVNSMADIEAILRETD